MHAQVARTLDGGKVARLVVPRHARRKVGQQPGRARAARGQGQLLQVGGFETDVPQAGHGPALAFGARRQAAGIALDGIGREIEGVELAQPGVLVGREHAERCAREREHFVALEDHMVLERVQRHAARLQGRAHARVARQGLGLVVVVGEHGRGAQLLRQPWNFRFGHALAHDQSGLRVAAERAQVRIQRHQAVPDELHAPVGARQRLEDGCIEKKHAMHLGAVAQGMKKSGMVAGAQIAPQPDQAHRARKFHGSPLKSKDAR
ncbi:hypothetical protein D3C78_1028000 [compost metagenome]